MTFITFILSLIAGHFIGVEAGGFTGICVFLVCVFLLMDGLRFRDIEERLKNLEK